MSCVQRYNFYIEQGCFLKDNMKLYVFLFQKHGVWGRKVCGLCFALCVASEGGEGSSAVVVVVHLGNGDEAVPFLRGKERKLETLAQCVRGNGMGERKSEQTDGIGGEGNGVEELNGYLVDDGGGLRNDVVRLATGEDLEVVKFHFKRQGAPIEVGSSESPLKVVRKFKQGFVDAGKVVDVALKGALASHAFALSLRFDRPMVDATCKVVVEMACFAEESYEVLFRALSKVFACVDASTYHALGRDTPHSPKRLDGQLVDEVDGTRGVNGAKAIGLAVVGGNFGQELIVRNACRSREMQFVADALLDVASDVGGQRNAPLVVRDIEECLVERERFDKVGVIGKDSVHLLRDGFVGRETGRNNC